MVEPLPVGVLSADDLPIQAHRIQFSDKTDNRTLSAVSITHGSVCGYFMEGEFGSGLKINCLNFFFFRLFCATYSWLYKNKYTHSRGAGRGRDTEKGETQSRDRAGCSSG